MRVLISVSFGRVDTIVADLEAGNYTLPVTAGFKRCRSKLPWWRGLPSIEQPLASAASAAAPAVVVESPGRGSPATADPPVQAHAAAVSSAPSARDASVQLPDPVSAPAPAPSVSARGPAPGPDPSLIDPRWLDGAAADLPACLRTEKDDVAVTVEDVAAGKLPRQVGHSTGSLPHKRSWQGYGAGLRA